MIRHPHGPFFNPVQSSMRCFVAVILGLGLVLAEQIPGFSQSCTTSQIQVGKLGLAQGGYTTLSSRPDQAPLGQLGSWTFSCTGGLSLSVNPPIARGTTPATASRGVQVWNGSPLSGGTLLTETTTTPTNTNLPSPLTNRTLFLHLYANSGGNLLTPGTYSYRVQLLVVPQ
jgi:hypothetical protein